MKNDQEQIKTDILVVGGGVGAIAAAIQAARRGRKTIIVSEFPWLGGMLTAAGVCAPDGNELVAWQTGLWGAFLRELSRKQPGGLAHGWVSLFTYHPAIAVEIFTNWVQELSNLTCIYGQIAREVLWQENRIIGVRFDEITIEATITIDGTELGDLLALGEIPYRWGWEFQAEFNEPSAPQCANHLTTTYPVQAPTWVFFWQDYGKDNIAPLIPPPPNYNSDKYHGFCDGYGVDKFLNYGRLPDDLFMINWPKQGNDYGVNLNRLIGNKSAQKEFLQEAFWYSQGFAYFLQTELGQRYGLANQIFPHHLSNNLGLNNLVKGGFALHPYYRESRRIKGQITITEPDILPIKNGSVAPLPMTNKGEVSAIALGNYANDHHYPGNELKLQSKSIKWGGRWTGTPFTIPFGAIIPEQIEGLLVCEKNISVSHIANGSTRLQPLVMNIGQAVGMVAALSLELNCDIKDLNIRKIQEELLTDKKAPAAIIPLFNLAPNHPEWLDWQRYYLDHPEQYPLDGNCPCKSIVEKGKGSREYSKERSPLALLTKGKNKADNISIERNNKDGDYYRGIFKKYQSEQYQICLLDNQAKQTWSLITIDPEINEQLKNGREGGLCEIWGQTNYAGGWLVVKQIYFCGC